MTLTTVKDLCQAAEDQGWTVERGKKHFRLVPPTRGEIVVLAGTPSCPHALSNTISRMKRSGFDPDLATKKKGKKS